ncbi:MAG TPA: Mov34/MPN/PAD-1 family protein [Anaerolineae bacterium]|nr:Mov34/MPN/PAD-1 family protein [Anaerolineae bacterium]
MNEEAAILTGWRRGRLWYGRLRQRAVGLPTEVAFDWGWALAREERHGDVLGFYHTHPAGFPTPSERDVRTMRAWVSSLGKPLLCVIASGDELAAYLFATDEDAGHALETVERFPRGVVVVIGGEKGSRL